MDFYQSKHCNSVLAAPPGVSIEECRALPVRRAVYDNGQPVVQSFWKPSAEELKQLQEGGSIVFTAWGYNHPPISLGVLEDA